MYTKQDQRLDKTVPALIVKHGNTAKKHFYLTERGTALGSARGCDIQLACDDVSGVHCIISRSSGGLSVRDCGSRLGTKVNGERVGEATLSDGDLIQVGLFVFEVSVPPSPSVEDTPVDRTDLYQKKIESLEQSRDRLVLLAWHLRRRLLEDKNAQNKDGAERAASANRPWALYELDLEKMQPRPQCVS